MPLAFLAPLFLGGLALLVAPWLIHQIRRPERETTRFSSLMFIPPTRREVIERRRIQHILLMLLRMAMLVFLALAFARPFWRTPAAAVTAPAGTTWHVILLDASYSMGVSGRFEKAKARAQAIVNSLEPTDRVGVIVFSRTPETVAPLVSGEEPLAGFAAPARLAIESAHLTEEATAYVPALQAAQAMFSSAEGQSAKAPAHLVAHLISDFQRVGLPEKIQRWKLGPRIELRCVDVSEPDNADCAIVDVSVRESGPEELRVLGKVRNWSNTREASRTIKLVAQGRQPSQSALPLAPGAARQVSFRIPIQPASSLEGWLELDSDPLQPADRRYFAWQAQRKRRVLLLASGNANQRPAAVRFLTSALPAERDLPWQLEIQSHESVKDALPNEEQRPSILIVEEMDQLTPEVCATIYRYVETGGRVLLALDGSAASEVPNKGLLARLGMRSDGPRYSEKREARFTLLSWVNFDHPIFVPLRGPQFNDFSSVHFYNHQRLSILTPQAKSESEENPRVIARFEPDADGHEWPAMLEARRGDGRVVIWVFGMDLEWSNLPRSVKFIPLLYETLSHLGSDAEGRQAWLVGEPLRPPKGTGNEKELPIVRLPGETAELDVGAVGRGASAVRARHAGFVRWRGTRNEPSEVVEAVNVRAEESNPERISPEEFQLKLCAPQMEPRPTAPSDLVRGSVGSRSDVHREYWRLLVGLLFAFFFVESWHAAARSRENS
jgi:hypothetical protein